MKSGITVGLAALVACAGLVSSAHAAFPGKNGRIIFERKASQFAGNSDPWVFSGGKARRLVRISNNAYNFSYSPNGKKIVFEATVPSEELVVMNANGTRPRVITAKVHKCIGKRHPTWSPNGKKIAFVCLNRNSLSDHDVWSVNANGTGIRRISRTHDAYSPAWSPRGNKIAYTTYGGSIYTVPARGGKSKLLIAEAPGGVFGGTFQGVDWSPNGRLLVSDSSGDGVYTINARTGATSGDLAEIGAEPVFSPDGKKILYVGIAESRGSTRIGLWKMNLDGSNKQQVTRGGYDRAPSWAPAR